jgi:outer membrane protein assembly factor BamB
VTALHSRRSFLALTSAAATASAGVAGATESETRPATDSSTPSTSTGNPPTAADDAATPTTATPTTATPEPTPVGDHHTFGVDPARSGHNPDEYGPTAPAVRWCVGSGGSNRLSELAVVDGVVYTGSPSEGLRALDAKTGETRWRATFDGSPRSPTALGDRVFTTDGYAVYGLGAGSGRELWAVRLGEQVTTSALVAGDGDDRTVFVAGEERVETTDDRAGSGERRRVPRVDALDAADGTARWTRRLDRGILYGALAARDGIVYGGGSTYDFYALDAATGETRWRRELGDHATSPAIGPESVFVGDESGTVHARDRIDGAERWTYDAGAEVRTSPAVAEGVVYVAAIDGYLHAIDAATGRRRWRFDGGRRLTVSPTVAGGGDDSTVYVGSGQGNVFAVDVATGEHRWSIQLTDRVETTPVVVDGLVFVGDDEGHIHALADESAIPDDAPACRAASEAPTEAPEDGTEDSDGDGVADRHDYAPRDSGVQRRADVESGDDTDLDFLSGVGVGAVVSAFGAGVGWWLGWRGGDRSEDDNSGGDRPDDVRSDDDRPGGD